jgi:hypothetical protein
VYWDVNVDSLVHQLSVFTFVHNSNVVKISAFDPGLINLKGHLVANLDSSVI